MVMAIPGQRFHLDLDSDDESDAQRPFGVGQDQSSSASRVLPLPSLLRDVTERPSSSTAQPPRPPQKTSGNGFPAHQKRSNVSALKNQRARAQKEGSVGQKGRGGSRIDDVEKQRIDLENRERLAQMSEEEIHRQRQELLDGLSPSLINRLLQKRTPIEEARHAADDKRAMNDQVSTLPDQSSEPLPSPSVTVQRDHYNPEAAPHSPPPDLTPASTLPRPPPPSKIHFPAPPALPPLDPLSSNFLTDLHEKYYPDLPHDPSKLAWMASEPTDANNTYSPTLSSLPASSIRFDFQGAILPPRTALTLPTAAGLHHHSAAPDAAGYTIPELAYLARSAFPAQRCVAYQTLGRIMYRLGKGSFGDDGSVLVEGLWECLEQGRVLDTLHEEVGEVVDETRVDGVGRVDEEEDEVKGGGGGRAGRGRHVSARVFATEALWNWQRGGGRRRKQEGEAEERS